MSPSDPLSLSLCMIVRDEEPVLARCLNSVTGVVDELIVVDTGSRDATATIARTHGATVIEHDFTDQDFSAARNAGLARARGRFVLVLDADETLDPRGLPELRAHLAWGEGAALILERRNRLPGASVPAWTDHVVRVFANRPEHRFRHRVHETVDESILEAGGSLRRSTIALDHHLPEEAGRQAKCHRYIDLLLAGLPGGDPRAAGPADVDRLEFLAADYHKLQRYTEATAVAEQVARLRPNDFQAHFTVALYHAAYGSDPERARAALTTALTLNPGDPEGLALLAALDEASPRDPGRSSAA